MVLACERKPECMKRTHRETGRTFKVHTGMDPD